MVEKPPAVQERSLRELGPSSDTYLPPSYMPVYPAQPGVYLCVGSRSGFFGCTPPW